MRMVLTRILSMTLLLALVGSGTARVTAQTNADNRLQVIASFSILADLVENVGGDLIDVTTLVSAGVDAHVYEPSPADVSILEDADLIFENGIEFETWLDAIYESSGSQAPRVVVTEGLELRTADDDHHDNSNRGHDENGLHDDDDHGHGDSDEATHDDDDDHGHGHDHVHGEFDPHVWQNVSYAMHMVEMIRDALAEADPVNAETYEANAATFLLELEELDVFIFEQVETLPEERRKLVTDHDTFGYFADRYGFEVVGTAIGAVSTEVGDPSAREIADLVDDIQAAGVPAIFTETIVNSDLMESVAAEAGVELAPPLYTDALGAPGTDGDTYIGMIRANITTIVTALSQ